MWCDVMWSHNDIVLLLHGSFLHAKLTKTQFWSDVRTWHLSSHRDKGSSQLLSQVPKYHKILADLKNTLLYQLWACSIIMFAVCITVKIQWNGKWHYSELGLYKKLHYSWCVHCEYVSKRSISLSPVRCSILSISLVHHKSCFVLSKQCHRMWAGNAMAVLQPASQPAHEPQYVQLI